MIFKTQKKIFFPLIPLAVFFINFFVIIFVIIFVLSTIDISAGYLIDVPKSNQAEIFPSTHLNISLSYVRDNKEEKVFVYFNDELMELGNLELFLIDYIRENDLLSKREKIILSLRVGKNVPSKYLVNIYEIVNRLNLVLKYVVTKD